MSLNETASGERIHIGFFGKRNAGKSRLVNAVTGQELSVVSEVKGTTTDPVRKAMELLPLGPVVIIDTAGIDDEGELGEQRVKKAMRILDETDLAVLVVDGTQGISPEDRELESLFKERKKPYLVAVNKSDLLTERGLKGENLVYVSAATGENVKELKEKLGAFAKRSEQPKLIVSDLLPERGTAVLVIPIDESAPKGRLILPQQLVLRDLLDAHCKAFCCRPEELKETLASLVKKPDLVITDSQVFEAVSKDTPSGVSLTSFSILMARYKGDLSTLVEGAAALSKLKDGDKVLISEGCTHHRQCNDIGTVKIPGWIKNYCGKAVEFAFTSGGEFPTELSDYALVVHCGGCMLNEAEMKSRIQKAKNAGVPIVNYGVAIACMHGILARSLEPFPAVLSLLG
ncbi:MAG: [Clostridia bacterium]|nr:[FeFe] hydrogenase H-cluster maturation GTPase HydF [Clostridia bacterium]